MTVYWLITTGTRLYCFSVRLDIRRIRINYRSIRKSVQEKVKNPKLRDKLLAKYGCRERMHVEDGLKKLTTLLAEIAREYNADLVRENLKDLKLSNGKRSKQLNYRLSTFPYRRFIEYIDYKFHERGLNILEVDAKGTSITCPVCGYADKRNRVDKETFKCRRCNFIFNAQYDACLNLFSRSDDGIVAKLPKLSGTGNHYPKTALEVRKKIVTGFSS